MLNLPMTAAMEHLQGNGGWKGQKGIGSLHSFCFRQFPAQEKRYMILQWNIRMGREIFWRQTG